MEKGYGVPRKRPLPEIAELRRRIRYEPNTGLLFWQADPPLRSSVGSSAALNSLTSSGYRRVQFTPGVFLFAHRVAFAIAYGRWPFMVDHINGNRLDNRAANLREVSCQQNNMNKRVQSNNVLRVKGVHLCKTTKRFRAQLKIGQKRVHVGYFDTVQEAEAAYAAAAKKHFKEHARAP